MFPSGSDNNPEPDQAADDTTKKLQTRRAKQPSLQEIQSKAQMTSLRTQCDVLFKAMVSACKSKDPVPLKNKVNLAIRGTNLLLHSSWNWQGVGSASQSREFHSIAGAMVLEFNIIAEYRDELIESECAASRLRSLFSMQLKPHMKRKPTMLQTLTRHTSEATMPAEFSFVDGIACSPIDSSDSFAVSDTLPLWMSYRDRQGDRELIQKIVHTVEKSPPAWQDPSNLTESKSPELNKEV